MNTDLDIDDCSNAIALHDSLGPFVYVLQRLPPRITLFPYTTLFRSQNVQTCQPSRSSGRNNSRGLAIVTGNSAALVLVTIARDRKSTRLNSSHITISYAVFCMKKKNRSSCCIRSNPNLVGMCGLITS